MRSNHKDILEKRPFTCTKCYEGCLYDLHLKSALFSHVLSDDNATHAKCVSSEHNGITRQKYVDDVLNTDFAIVCFGHSRKENHKKLDTFGNAA